MEAECPSAEEKQRKGKMGLSKNRYKENMAGNWWNAKMEGGREKLAATGEDTGAAASRSRAPKLDSERGG